jgi:hypothetical protein
MLLAKLTEGGNKNIQLYADGNHSSSRMLTWILPFILPPRQAPEAEPPNWPFVPHHPLAFPSSLSVSSVQQAVTVHHFLIPIQWFFFGKSILLCCSFSVRKK